MNLFKSIILLLGFIFTSNIYAASITISGKVTEAGVPKANILVKFYDNMSWATDSVRSNSLGEYTVTLNTGRITSGMVDSYVIDCNGNSDFKSVNYNSSSSNYPNVDFVYCKLSQSNSYTVTIEGSVSKIPTTTSFVNLYCDTNGAFKIHMNQQVTSTSTNYKFKFRVANASKTIRVFLVDCQLDTVFQDITISNSSLTHTGIDLAYCKPIPSYQVNISGFITNMPPTTEKVYLDTTGGNIGHLMDPVTKSSNKYEITFMTNKPSGKARVFIVDCKHDTVSKVVSFASFQPTLVRVDLNYCTSSPNTKYVSVSGAITNCNTITWQYIYCDSLGGSAQHIKKNFNKTLGTYQIAFPTSKTSGKFRLHLVDCHSNTLDTVINYSTNSLVFSNIDFDYCRSTIGIRNVIASDLWVSGYPNPVLRHFTMNFMDPQNSVEVVVMRITGEQVTHRFYQNISNLNLSLENLSSGVYLIKVVGEKQTKNFRVYKQ